MIDVPISEQRVLRDVDGRLRERAFDASAHEHAHAFFESPVDEAAAADPFRDERSALVLQTGFHDFEAADAAFFYGDDPADRVFFAAFGPPQLRRGRRETQVVVPERKVLQEVPGGFDADLAQERGGLLTDSTELADVHAVHACRSSSDVRA